MDGRKSSVENNIVNNTFKLGRHVKNILDPLFPIKLKSEESMLLAKFLEIHSKNYGFIKLILVILLSLSNFLFYPFLPITMEKYPLREIWFCFKWLIIEPKGTYKKDLFFQCIFLATEPKALKMQSEQQIESYESWRECHQFRNYGFQSCIWERTDF